MKISPASVVGGISTAISAFLISFSRTISARPFDGLFGRGRRGDLNPRHVPHASTASLIQRNDDPEMVSIEWLAVYALCQNYPLRLEFGRDLTKRQHRSISVSTENHDRLRHLVSMFRRIDHSGLLEHRPQ